MQALLLKLANSLKAIWITYVGSLVVSACLFSWVEGKPLLDGLWWSCATALTVGYGDIAPVTVAGKWLGIVFAHLWILITIPLVVANVIVKIIHDAEAFTQEEQDEVKGNLRRVLTLLETK
ncbi:MAG: potassium channel family protein [Bacteroidales bacterium]